ncbi:undecaprenyl-phosphate glucose phosphotransferase [uncultured Chloroflexus sp.]|uniref:undecaprenyl-phosphate glucose phosphotransferase n=1 Tax=uncultured Chloroflexus sp. TaxID=214040 RepID=UPI00262E8546|nr:undecaprenyl-phosphate glucose phosphotransferase [uncultured Chloroflexus sp.]
MAAISSSHPTRTASVKVRSLLRPRSWRALLRLLLVVLDMAALNLAAQLAYAFGTDSLAAAGFRMPADPLTPLRLSVLGSVTALIVFASHGLYEMKRGASRLDEAVKVVTAVSFTMVLVIFINALIGEFGGEEMPWTRDILVQGWGLAVAVCLLGRFLHRALVYALRRYFDIDTRRVLIVGAREPGRLVWNTIRRRPELGYRVQGFLSDTVPIGEIVDGLPVLGRTEHICRVIRATRADEVIIALSGRSSQDLVEVIALAEDESVEIKVYPDTFQLITNNEVSIGDLRDLPLVSVKNAALDNPWNRALKRGLDLVVASLVLLFAAPVMLLIALAIRLESRGPVFFLQERVGLDGKPFWMIKFRTMRPDAEQFGTWTVQNDPRVTRVGRWLRRTSLDELPQLINVLIGEMSIVGPRPEQARWVEQFRQQIPRYMRRHKEKAGLTGWAQVNGLRGDTSIEERTRYDLYYVENWSLLFDIKIILRTIINFITGRQENAY